MKIKKKIFIPLSVIAAAAVIVLMVFVPRKSGSSLGSGDLSQSRPFKVFRMDLADKITEVGEVTPSEVYSLRFPVSQKVTQVNVSEDAVVKKGDRLICIDDTQVLSQKKSLETQILKMEYDLRAAEIMDRKTKLELEERILEGKNNALLSGNRLKAAEEMYAKELISKEKLDLVRNQTKAVHNALEILLEEEKKLENQSLQTEALSKNLESLRFRLKELNTVLDECCLESPIDGKVIWMKQVKVGELAVQNDVAVRVADMNKVEIKAYLFESDVWRIERGAEIYMRSGEEQIPATLKRISDVAEKSPSGTRFPCFMESENIGDRFRVGSSVEVVFLVDKRPQVLVVPLKYLIQKQGRHYVLKREGDRVTQEQVEIGFDDTKYVEILDGLDEGETIVYPYERF